MSDAPNQVERVECQVIEGKLLAALSDKGTVGILCSEPDLDILIGALLLSENDRMALKTQWMEMRRSLEQLKSEAFGK